MKNKKIRMSIIIIILISIVCIVTGITYAYFSSNSKTANKVVSTGTLDITYNQGQVIKTNGIYPIKEEQISSKATELNFSVTNNGTLTGYFDIHLKDIIMDPELKDENFKWRLYQKGTIISEGNFQDATTQLLITSNIPIESKETKEYKIIVWIQESNSLQNHMQDKTFRGKITIKALDRQNTFAESESPKLENTVKNEVIALTLKGNSIQNGNPTPETPVEVESVGDKTKNLFDVNKFVELVKKYEPIAEVVTIDGRRCIKFRNYNLHRKDFSSVVNFETGKQYVWTMDIKAISSTGGSFFLGYIYEGENYNETNPTSYQHHVKDYLEFGKTKSVISTFGKNVSQIGFSYGSGGTWAIDLDSIQIEEGTTPTDYEPYDKYKISIKTTGKNLFNLNEIENKKGITINNSTNTVTLSVYQSYGYYDWKKYLKPNTTYTIFYNFPDEIGSNTIVGRIAMAKDTSSSIMNLISEVSKKGIQRAVFTTPNDLSEAKMICMYGTSTMENIQIIEGDISLEDMPDFEPYQEKKYDIYLDEPLRGIGDAKDYIDFKNKTIVRKIKSKTFTNTDSNWLLGSSGVNTINQRYYYALSDAIKGGRVMSNFLPEIYPGNYLIFNKDETGCNISNGKYLQFKVPINLLTNAGYTTSASDFMTYLYSLTNKLNIIYTLEVPSDPVSIDIPNIKAFDGTTYISLDTNVNGTFDGSY